MDILPVISFTDISLSWRKIGLIHGSISEKARLHEGHGSKDGEIPRGERFTISTERRRRGEREKAGRGEKDVMNPRD